MGNYPIGKIQDYLNTQRDWDSEDQRAPDHPKSMIQRTLIQKTSKDPALKCRDMILLAILAALPALASNEAREPLTAAPKPTVVTVIEYSYDTRLLASVVSAQPSATTYSLGCPVSEGISCFGYGNGIPTITVIAGPSTAAQTLNIEKLGLAIQINCQLTTTSPFAGPCVKNVRSGGLVDTTSFDAAGTMWATFVGITVTGGLEKLSVSGSISSTGASSATSSEYHSHYAGSSVTSTGGESALTTVTIPASSGVGVAGTGAPTTTTRGNAGVRGSRFDLISLVLFTSAFMMAI